MSISTTTSDVVSGKKVAIIHVEVDTSTTEPTTTRTVLKPCGREDLTATSEGEETDFTPAAEYNTQRWNISGTFDIEMSMPMSDDLSNLEKIGLVDSDGSLNRGGMTASIGFGDTEEYLEWAYFDHVPDFANMTDIETEAEIINRFGKVKFNNPELDASEAPPTVTLTGWVEGDIFYNYAAGSGGA